MRRSSLSTSYGLSVCARHRRRHTFRRWASVWKTTQTHMLTLTDRQLRVGGCTSTDTDTALTHMQHEDSCRCAWHGAYIVRYTILALILTLTDPHDAVSFNTYDTLVLRSVNSIVEIYLVGSMTIAFTQLSLRRVDRSFIWKGAHDYVFVKVGRPPFCCSRRSTPRL